MTALGTFLAITGWHWLKIIFFHQKGKEQCVFGAQFGIQRTPKDGYGLIHSPVAQRSILGQGLQCVCAFLFWGSSPWSTQLFSPFAHPAPLASFCSKEVPATDTQAGRESQARALPSDCSLGQGRSNFQLEGHYQAWHLGLEWAAQLRKISDLQISLLVGEDAG